MLKHSWFSKNMWNPASFRRWFARMMNAVILAALLLSPLGVNAAPVETHNLSLPPKLLMQAASWFDPAWTYRRPVVISNTGLARTDYQVLVTLDSTFAFAHAASDGSDIRIATEDGTALPFWMETWQPGTTLARIWVRVGSIPTAGTTIYLYYGNPAASSASSGTATFEFFDTDWTSLASRWSINWRITIGCRWDC